MTRVGDALRELITESREVIFFQILMTRRERSYPAEFCISCFSPLSVTECRNGEVGYVHESIIGKYKESIISIIYNLDLNYRTNKVFTYIDYYGYRIRF